ASPALVAHTVKSYSYLTHHSLLRLHDANTTYTLRATRTQDHPVIASHCFKRYIKNWHGKCFVIGRTKIKPRQYPITRTRFSSTHNKNKTCECSKLIFLENGKPPAGEHNVRLDREE